MTDPDLVTLKLDEELAIRIAEAAHNALFGLHQVYASQQGYQLDAPKTLAACDKLTRERWLLVGSAIRDELRRMSVD